MSGAKLCFPACRDFMCTKRALVSRGKQSWCDWTNEECMPKSCNYASCFRRQLLENGVCSKTIKRRTQEDERPDDLFREEIKVRGKLMRKTGERVIF